MRAREGGPGPSRGAVRVFRWLLRLYPREFRSVYAAGMEETFVSRGAELEAEGRPLWWFYVRTAANLVASGLSERLRPTAVARGAVDRGEIGGGMGYVDAIRQDLRFAVRSLVRNPGFAMLAILTLALGVGANTAMFSVVNGVLLRPLPYPGSESLVVVWTRDAEDPGEGRGVMSAPDIADLGESPVFRSLVGYSASSVTLTGVGTAEGVDAARVTAGLLSTFGYAPALGRDLRAEEADPSAPRVVVIGYDFWQGRLGGRADVLGRALELGGYEHEVVGVAPAGFGFPGAELWIPVRQDPESCARDCHTLEAVGRLASGSDVPAAQGQASAVGRALAEAYPDSNHGKDFLVVSLREEVVGDVRAGLLILLGAVGLVLLIACANVANLLLVRATARTGEVAVRRALGASRGRLLGQILLESAVLAVLGGAFGLALAQGGLTVLRRVEAGNVPRIEQVFIDGTALMFTLAVVVAVTLLFGLSPALRLSRASIQNTLVRHGRGSRPEVRLRSLLLGVQVAFSLILLVGAGLLMRSFAQIHAVDLGYDTEEILRFSLLLPGSRYESLDEVAGFYEELEARIRALPGVAAVGSVFGAPLAPGNAVGEVLVNDEPEAAPGEERYAALRLATPGYLDAMGIPVVRGRGIEPTDRAGSPPVALVNQSLVRENFRGVDPIGQRVRVTVDVGYGSPELTVVGVVPDVRTSEIRREPRPEVFAPQRQMGPGFMTTAVRGVPGSGPLIGPIRAEIAGMDPALPVYRVETMEQAVAREAAPTRFYLVLAVLFAGMALSLAIVGVYGVVAFLVSQRTREIGIRLALGARGADVVRMVVRQGLRPALVGLVAGIMATIGGARVLEAVLFGVSPRDPATLLMATSFVLAVTLLAISLPARRATRVDPVRALKQVTPPP